MTVLVQSDNLIFLLSDNHNASVMAAAGRSARSSLVIAAQT
jgi:hypothetical protein